MLQTKRFTKPLKELLKLPTRFTGEERLLMDTVLPTLIMLQELPDIAIEMTTGVVLPTHQRTTLYQCHLGYENNYNVSSRGTSKTTNVAVFYFPYKGTFFSKRKQVTLSATGFRGSQLIMSDIQRWLEGGFVDQEADVYLMRDSVLGDHVVKRGQTMWTIEHASKSLNMGLPTNDHDRIRGIRANDVVFDEFNMGDEDLIERVIIPFLNVTGDFRHGGAYAEKNSIYFTTTIDYQWRPAQKRISAAKESIRRDMLWSEACHKGDHQLAEEIEKQGILNSTYVSFDYTDTLIRRTLTTRTGKRYKVNYPDENMVLRTFKEGIPFTERDAEGRMTKAAQPIDGWSTYPINKLQLEQGLLDGSTDEAVWLSEQRNIIDSSTGEVYSHQLVADASCEGAREVIPWELCNAEWQQQHPDGIGWVPLVQWECPDPCVVGIDYAPGGGDFCALFVIRLGPCSTGDFNPVTGFGKSTFSNVIWMEQHRRMSGRDVAERMWEYGQRYNLAYHHDPYVEDTWELCRAVGLDVRGGGNAARDELVRINDQTLAPGQYRMYDPLDKDDRVLGFAATGNSFDTKAMLDCIRPTPQINDKLVEWTLAQMQQGFLYFPKYLDRSERGDRKLDIAYEATKSFTNQLRKLQQEPTAQGRKFFIEGDTSHVENKKDLVSAFWYASKQHRAHIIRQRTIDNTPPPMGGVVTRVNRQKGRTHGRVSGSKGWDRR